MNFFKSLLYDNDKDYYEALEYEKEEEAKKVAKEREEFYDAYCREEARKIAEEVDRPRGKSKAFQDEMDRIYQMEQEQLIRELEQGIAEIDEELRNPKKELTRQDYIAMFEEKEY